MNENKYLITDKEAWLKEKETTVGSSEIAAVMGLSKFQSQLGLYMQKKKITPAIETNGYMRIGLALEPVIGEHLYPEKTGEKTIKCQYMYRHPEYHFAVATPDYLTESNKIVECKTGNFYSLADWRDGGAPIAYRLQLQWQLGVCQIPAGDLAGMIGGDPKNFYIHSYNFSESIFDACIAKATEFMDYLNKNIIPPATVAEDKKLLEIIYSDRVDEVVQLNEEIEVISNQLVPLREAKSHMNKEVKEIDEQIDGLEARALQLLGNNTKGIYQDIFVELKISARKAYSVEAKTVKTLKITKGK